MRLLYQFQNVRLEHLSARVEHNFFNMFNNTILKSDTPTFCIGTKFKMACPHNLKILFALQLMFVSYYTIFVILRQTQEPVSSLP